jgi:polysaccharide export outer membrane protein
MHILFSIRRSLLLFVTAGCFMMLFCSCGNTRQLIYMQGKFDTAALSKIVFKESIIQKGDILSIIVYSDNPDATKIYNQSLIQVASSSAVGAAGSGNGASSFSGNSPSTPGYLVDENGDIEFQGLGRLHVDSLTRSQLKDTLNARLSNFLVNPYYSIRFLNARFTMLGEVAKPGIYTIPGDRISLLEALGVAGDMTFFGRRDNIVVIREILGKREWGRLDITKPDIMASPFYYLQSNDVVIVEPTRKKVAANDLTTVRNITIASTIVSTLAILYSIFHK